MVAVPVPMVGRSIVPAGGAMPIRASKVLVGAFVTPWPISHSPVLRTRPEEYVARVEEDAVAGVGADGGTRGAGC